VIKRILLNILTSGLALFFTDYFLDVIDIKYVDLPSYLKTLVIAVVVLGLLNTFIKPFLTAISFPFLILSLGLFSIIIHAIVFFLLTIFIPDISVYALWGYFVVPIILGIFNFLVHLLLPSNK